MTNVITQKLPFFRSKDNLYDFDFPNPKDDYLIHSLEEIKELGSGTYGTVYAVKGYMSPEDDEPIFMAAKKIGIADTVWKEKDDNPFYGDFYEKLLRDTTNEIALLQEIAPLKIYNAYLEETETGKRNLVILMQLIDGESGSRFGKERKSLDAKQAKELLSYLLATAACMEEKGIIHFDIKPGNIMVNYIAGKHTLNYVLVDWGLGCWEDADVPWRMRCELEDFGTIFGPYRFLDADFEDKDVARRFEAISRRLKDCYKRKGDEKGYDTNAGLDSSDNGFVTYLLRQEDLWAIAVSVLQMAGIKINDYIERDPHDLKYEYEVSSSVIAKNFLTMDFAELINAMVRRGFDKATMNTIVAILDFENKYGYGPCVDARNLLIVLYDGRGKNEACKNAREGGVRAKVSQAYGLPNLSQRKTDTNNLFLPNYLPVQLDFLRAYDLPVIEGETDARNVEFLVITSKNGGSRSIAIPQKTFQKIPVAEEIFPVRRMAFSADLKTILLYGNNPMEKEEVSVSVEEAIEILLDLSQIKGLEWKMTGREANARGKSGRGNNYFLPLDLPPSIEFIAEHNLAYWKENLEDYDPKNLQFVEVISKNNGSLNKILGEPVFSDMPQLDPRMLWASPNLQIWKMLPVGFGPFTTVRLSSTEKGIEILERLQAHNDEIEWSFRGDRNHVLPIDHT